MTEHDLNNAWARAQIEAWVDGSLPRASRARMADAVRRDPRLAAAVERAVAVRHALRASPAASMPAGLRRRLLAIARQPSPARPWRSLLAAAAAVAVAAVGVWLARPAVEPEPDPRVVAIQEFELAMRYVQKSARITQSEVTGAVGTGLREALTTAARRSDETRMKLEGETHEL